MEIYTASSLAKQDFVPKNLFLNRGMITQVCGSFREAIEKLLHEQDAMRSSFIILSTLVL